MSGDTFSTLAQLTADSGYELEDAPIQACPAAVPAEPAAQPCPRLDANAAIPEIFRAKKSGGGEMRLLKTVLTSACERNCNYCAFRAGRDVRRGTLKPDDMAKVFTGLYAGGVAEWLFLVACVIGCGVRSRC